MSATKILTEREILLMFRKCPFCGIRPTFTVQIAPRGWQNTFTGIDAFVKCDSPRCKIQPSLQIRIQSFNPTSGTWFNECKDEAGRKLAEVWNDRRG